MELLKSNDEAGYVLGNIVKKTGEDANCSKRHTGVAEQAPPILFLEIGTLPHKGYNRKKYEGSGHWFRCA